jgi:hypothetical protein
LVRLRRSGVSQAFTRHHLFGPIEPAREAIEQLVDLGLGDDKGRADGERVADGAGDEPLVLDERTRVPTNSLG